MFESVLETCSQTNNISLYVTPAPVKLWHGQQPLNQTDTAIDLILNCDAIQILLFNQWTSKYSVHLKRPIVMIE